MALMLRCSWEQCDKELHLPDHCTCSQYNWGTAAGWYKTGGNKWYCDSCSVGWHANSDAQDAFAALCWACRGWVNAAGLAPPSSGGAASSSAAAASSTSPPSSGGPAPKKKLKPADYMEDWEPTPMSEARHNVPLALRREWCEPLREWQPMDKLDLLSSIVDALMFSDLWDRLSRWDVANESQRKPTSYFGAVPRRTFGCAKGSGKGGLQDSYEDPGNHPYWCALKLLQYIAVKLNFPPLARWNALASIKQSIGRAGDIVEATLGELFEGQDGYQDDQEWWSMPWRIDPATPTGLACSRFLTFFGKFQRHQLSPLRIKVSYDVDHIWGDRLDEQLELLKTRAAQHGDTVRVRSLAGQRRSYDRDAARAADRIARGKGLGKKGGKGKGQSASPPSSGGSGKDAASWPPRGWS